VDIAEDAEIDALRERLDAAAMPEQLFGDSYLRLTHSSGTTLEFNAADALAAWKDEALPPVQVRSVCLDALMAIGMHAGSMLSDAVHGSRWDTPANGRTNEETRSLKLPP
jgi:hypothetical protein